MHYNAFKQYYFIIIILNYIDVICSQPTKLHQETETIKEIDDLGPPITLDKIKERLRETGIFDMNETTLSPSEKKELDRLYVTIEIMMASRNRQPSNVQSTFTSLRLVERIIDKQVKEGHLSIALANKFKWNKLSLRPKRDRPMFEFDKRNNMRIFYVD